MLFAYYFNALPESVYLLPVLVEDLLVSADT